MVGDKNIAIVYCHIPLNGIALQITKATISDLHTIQLVMKSLAQDPVISMGDGNIIDGKVAHHTLFFTADIYLRHRTKTAHHDSFNQAVRSTHIEGNIMQAPAFLPYYLATILQNKSTTPITAYVTLQK